MNLLIEFWSDLHEPQVWWQVVVALLSLLATYVVTRFLNRRFPVNTTLSDAEIITSQSFANIRFPAILWSFLFVGKLILFAWLPARTTDWLSLFTLIVGSLALIRFGIYLSRRIFLRNHKMSDLHLLIEKIFSWGVWLVAIFYYLGILQDAWVFLDETTISIGKNKLSIATILQTLITVVITVLLALWASAALERRLMSVDTLHASLRMVLSRVGSSLLILCAVLISMNLVGIDLTVLSVFGGALGVGVGLGLQRIASNYVSGFIILLDRSVSVNDLITVDKYSGKVSKINTRYTVLKGLDGVESIIPNEMLTSSPVQNLSSSIKGVAFSTNLTVAYHTEIETLVPQLIELVSGIDGVSNKSVPSVNLMNFGANGLELNIGFWITIPADKAAVISKVNRAIWKLLQERNIQVPYPQTEVRILNSETATK